MNKIQERIAKKTVAPVILKLLKPYKATEMANAISNNLNLAKGLQEDAKYLKSLRVLTIGVPFVDDLANNIKKKKWIMWFLNNELKHKRPDLYNQIVYHPNGTKYIRRQIRMIVDLVFV